jgi:hypothetical protein
MRVLSLSVQETQCQVPIEDGKVLAIFSQNLPEVARALIG